MQKDERERKRERERNVYFTVMELAYLWVFYKIYKLKFSGTRVDFL